MSSDFISCVIIYLDNYLSYYFLYSALIADSKIPRPSTLASPTPLRRSGSLRLRGEKLGFSHSRISSGKPGPGAFHSSSRTSPGTTFPSITEACESWKKNLRGAGDGPTNSTLRQHHHHRSLVSILLFSKFDPFNFHNLNIQLQWLVYKIFVQIYHFSGSIKSLFISVHCCYDGYSERFVLKHFALY